MPSNKRLKFIEDWEFGNCDLPRINAGGGDFPRINGGGAIPSEFAREGGEIPVTPTDKELMMEDAQQK